MRKYKVTLEYDFDCDYIATEEIFDYASEAELISFTDIDWADWAAQRIDVLFEYGKCDMEEAIFYKTYKEDMVTVVTEKVLQLVENWKAENE